MSSIKRNFRHVGYIVEDLAVSVAKFQLLFDLTDDDVRIVPPYDVPSDSRFAFFTVDGLDFELIEPISDYFKEVLFNSGKGLNHICFTVDDIETAVNQLLNTKGGLVHPICSTLSNTN